MSRYVARRRVELGLLQHEVSIPQSHLAGAEAEVDFGESYATIAGLVVKCWMFVMRLSPRRGVPAGPLNDMAQAFTLAEELGLTTVVPVPGTQTPQVANPISLSATPPTYRSGPPTLGSLTDNPVGGGSSDCQI